jgi:myo-inositol-1(or 4)-monophosphatase
MFDPSHELAAMKAAAEAAGTGLMRRFRSRSSLTIDLKGPADFVSTADLESEATLKAALLGAYPSFGFVTEESAPTEGTDRNRTRFIVDPLDGTTNFLHGIPHFAISIALEQGGRIVAGLVFDPPKNEMFVAEEGRGAWLGGERLAVSDDHDLSMSVAGTGIPHIQRGRHDEYLPLLAATMREVAGIRRLAAAAIDLAYVAAGRFDVFFEFGLARWDLAAGILLVREAGGRVTEPAGGGDMLGSGDVLATNGHLHERMLALLRDAALPPE